MRDPRNAFRPFIVKETQAAREQLAAAHFELDVVAQRITDAAKRGEGALRLPLGQIATELRETEAARQLVAWCEANALRLEWAERVLERPDGLKLRTMEAVITWVEEARA
jgi:hypothetical protein